MLKHVSNFFLQIFPSVVATVVGAYIVTNYISNKPAADAPKAAVASTAEPARDVTPAKDAGPAAAAAKADAPSGDADKPKQAEKPAADARRQASREKPAEKPVQAAPLAAVPPVQAVAVAPAAPAADPVPTSATRDANDLARAALDRLRGPIEGAKQPEASKQTEAPRQSEAAKPPEPQRQAAPARAAEPPKVAAATPSQPHVQQTVQPLPPAMLVTAPNTGSGPRSEESGVAKPREPSRDTRALPSFRPPADIPSAPPLDLQAASREPTSIADDVVATARSVFQAVIPR